jgi:regulator of protease activity HflC (stomatin/prohibitin superfamily)
MAFEFIFNALAIVFFVMMFAGIVLVVLGVSRGQNARLGVVLAVIGLVLGVIALIASQGVVVVGPTDRAVKFNSATGELATPLDPGIHIIWPGIDETIPYNVSEQTHSMTGDDAVAARSADGQNIEVDVTIIFSIDPAKLNQVHLDYSRLEQGFVIEVIRPVVRNEVREVFATVSAQDLYGSLEQVTEGEVESSSLELVNGEIETRIRTELAEDGFLVSRVLLRNISFSPEFVDAIESRQVAELERDRASVEAETAQIEAEGRANARIEQARGEAEATLLEAEAEAEALRLVSEQIASNPNLIQYTYINELGDNVSLVIIPSNSPFLFDPTTFTEMGADFTAPESQLPTATEEAQPETETSGD